MDDRRISSSGILDGLDDTSCEGNCVTTDQKVGCPSPSGGAPRPLPVRTSSHLGDQQPGSRWVGLESMNALLLADERNDGLQVSFRQSFNRFHVPKPPVVLRHSTSRRKDESGVAVVVRFVHNRQMRRAFVGASQVGTVTRGTVSGVERLSSVDEFRVLDSDSSTAVATATARRHQYDKAHTHDTKGDTANAFSSHDHQLSQFPSPTGA